MTRPRPFTLALLTLLAVVGRAAGDDGESAGSESAGSDSTGIDDPVAYLRLRVPAHTAPVKRLAFSADGETLYSTGDDKVVRAWRRDGGAWRLGGTARWEVGYGKNGQVLALGVDATRGLIAIGGHGNRGGHGEIVWFDPARLNKYYAWRFPKGGAASTFEHRQVVTAAEFSPDGRWFASADLTGQVLLWPGPKQQAAGELKPPIRRLYQADVDRWRDKVYQPIGVRPVCWLGSDAVVHPKHVGQTNATGPGYAIWQLEQSSVAGAANNATLPTKFYGQLTTLAATPNGKRLVAAGQTVLALYDFSAGKLTSNRMLEGPIQPDKYIYALSLSDDGRWMALGRVDAVDARWAPTRGAIELWDLANPQAPRRRWRSTTPAVVSACAISGDGGRLAYAEGNDLYTVTLQNGAAAEPARKTMPGGDQITSVGFLSDAVGDQADPSYRVLFETTTSRRVFDPAAEDMIRQLPSDAKSPNVVASSGVNAGVWRVDGVRGSTGVSVRRAGQPAIRLPIDAQRHGMATSHCWILDAQGAPRQLALGMQKSGVVKVFDLPRAGQRGVQLARYFLGHEGAITSLGVSDDQAYLVSGSTDGSAAIWRLKANPEADQAGDATLANIWGVRLEAAGDGARVAWLDAQGPLYNRGIEVGDVLTEALWTEAGAARTAKGHDAIRRVLASAKPNSDPPQIALQVRRAGDGRTIPLQVAPIWNPLLSLYSREWNWIAWTPSGYYESSVQGDELIGWQFTRAVGEAPLFATADQFYKRMRRPELIRNLLSSGSLADAAEQAGVEEVEKVAPAKLPVVQIVSPAPGVFESQQQEFELVAEVNVSPGERIEQVALLRDGVVEERREVTDTSTAIKTRWQVELEDPAYYEFSVQAWATSGDATSTQNLAARWLGRQRRVNPKTLWVLAVGVAEYPSSVAPAPLRFATADAERIASVFNDRHAYDEVRLSLLSTPAETTGERIRQELNTLIERPDYNDTAVFFFAGHSTEPDASAPEGEEISLLPIDGPDAALSPSGLLRRFCERDRLRKVVILDSCRSGRFERMVEDLARNCSQKSCGASFFASCEGDQLSRESADLRSGWFTHFVVDGLGGKAAPYSSTVSDFGLASYLHAMKSESGDSPQQPVIYVPNREVRLPLTKR